MSRTRRRLTFALTLVSVFALSPPTCVVDTAHAASRIAKKFNKAGHVNPVRGRTAKSGTGKRSAGLARKSNPVKTLRLPSRYQPAKRNSGTTVLGHFPNYILKANEHGRRDRYFNIPTRHWDRMSKVQRWRANRKFLDRTIRRRDRIDLSIAAKKAGTKSDLQWELAYLGSKGYTVSRDGKELLPPTRR